MRVGDEQLVDPVVFLGRRRLLAAAAALLRAVFGERLRSSCSRACDSVTTMSCGVIRSSVARSLRVVLDDLRVRALVAELVA